MNEVLGRNILLYWKIGKSAILDITKKTPKIVSTRLGWEQAQMRDKLLQVIDSSSNHFEIKAGIFNEKFIKPDGSKLIAGKVNEIELRKLCSIGALRAERTVDSYRKIGVYTLDDYTELNIAEYIPKIPDSKTFRKNFVAEFGEEYLNRLEKAILADIADNNKEFNNIGSLIGSLEDANRLIDAVSRIGCASMYRELINMKYEVLDEIAEEILDAAEAVRIRDGFRLK